MLVRTTKRKKSRSMTRSTCFVMGLALGALIVFALFSINEPGLPLDYYSSLQVLVTDDKARIPETQQKPNVPVEQNQQKIQPPPPPVPAPATLPPTPAPIAATPLPTIKVTPEPEKSVFFTYKPTPQGKGTTKEDYFASSFWQSVEVFQRLHLRGITNFEGVFARSTFYNDVARGTRLAYDYLDFSVEHLSKWWKMAGEDTYPYIVERLEAYSHRSCSNVRSTFMDTTVAMLPFCVSEQSSNLTKMIWKASLKASLCSVWQHSPKRINVVGMFPLDGKIAREVLQEIGAVGQPLKTDLFTLGQTELQYIQADAPLVGNKLSQRDKEQFEKGALPVYNLPMASWQGLHDAMVLKNNTELWLGANNEYKFVYFSETDQILNARMHPQFLHEMDAKKHVLVPHRLQPIPHRYDFGRFVPEGKVKEILPESFREVVELDAGSSCCDTRSHLDAIPENCWGFWWQCGFQHPTTGNFSYLDGYQFMALKEGTGFASLAGTEHSRRCQPHVGTRNCGPDTY